MKEICLQAAGHRRRARRLCLRHPRRPARPRHRPRRGGQARRHLPQCRLHPVQGADPCRRGVRRRSQHCAAGKSPLGISASTRRRSTSAKTVAWKDGIVGRLTSGVAGAAEEGARSRSSTAGRAFRDGKTVEVETETGAADHPRRERRHRHRLGAGRTAVPALRRPGDLLDRGAGADERAADASPWSAAAISGSSSASPSPSSARRSRWSRRRTRILPLYDAELTRPVAKRLRRARRRGADRRQGQGARRTRATRSASRPRAAQARDIAADKILVTVGRKPLLDGWGLEELDLDRDRRVPADRRPVPHLDARRLRDRRRHRRADAGASRHGAGRDGRRDRRRPQARLGQALHPGRLLHRSGDRHASASRPTRRRRRPRGQDRPVPLPRQRPRDDAGRRGRLRARRGARRQSSRARHPGGRRRACRNCRPPSAWRSRWARGWRTSPARSTPTRRWARPSRRPR